MTAAPAQPRPMRAEGRRDAVPRWMLLSAIMLVLLQAGGASASAGD